MTLKCIHATRGLQGFSCVIFVDHNSFHLCILKCSLQVFDTGFIAMNDSMGNEYHGLMQVITNTKCSNIALHLASQNGHVYHLSITKHHPSNTIIPSTLQK